MNQVIVANGRNVAVTIVKPTTKKGAQIMRNYAYSKLGDSIYTAYKKPSSKKARAFYIIKKEMEDTGGYNIKITGAGSDIFSCAYMLVDDTKQKYIIYHTPLNRFAVPVV